MAHTVLIVDDEQDLREMMRDALELNGYTAVTATNGVDALNKQALHDRGSVLGDSGPAHARDGCWEFLERMHQRDAHASVPVVVYTSAPARAPTGVAKVLQKPLAFEQLLSVVRECCVYGLAAGKPQAT